MGKTERRKYGKTASCVVLLILIVSTPAAAQYDITLQDGRSFEGLIVDASGGAVTVEVYVPSREDYVTTTLRRADIFRVESRASGRDVTAALLDGDADVRRRTHDATVADMRRAYPESVPAGEEYSALLRSPLPRRMPAEAPYWDTESDPLAYHSEMLVDVSQVPGRTWISGAEALYVFRPLRHDHLYGSVPGKRIIPQSWLGLHGEYGPIRESHYGYSRGVAARVEGAVLLTESVGIGGMVDVFDWKPDLQFGSDSETEYESGKIFAAVVDLHPSRRVHLREKLGGGSVDFDRDFMFLDDGPAERFTYDTRNMLYFSHALDIVFGKSAYAHEVELQYFDAEFFIVDFVQYLEFAGNPDITFAPMMRFRSIGGTYGTESSFSSYGMAFRWYIVPMLMLQLEPQIYSRNDADGRDRMEILLQSRLGVRF
jgi:hypothetical protein